MDKNIFKGKWKQLKGSVQEQWGELTDDEIDQINGEWAQLVGKLQEKYGYNKTRAEKQINDFMLEMEQD
jgi:uncharacterized protein YjbJ (UPF0337 family)